MFKLWLIISRFFTILFNRNYKFKKEIKAVKEVMKRYNIIAIKDVGEYITNVLRYIPDKPIDRQKLAYETIKDKGGDCEDLHRVAQLMIYLLLRTKKVYLMNVSCKSYNPKKDFAHAFVIFKKLDGSYSALDYKKLVTRPTVLELIKIIMGVHGCPHSSHFETVIFDLHLRHLNTI